MTARVFTVKADRLRLRVQPSLDAPILTRLEKGQAVARLDEKDWNGWWYIFADTPGRGVYTGYVDAGYLSVWDDGDYVVENVSSSEVEEDDDEDPVREPQPVGPVDVVWSDGWNPVVPAERRHAGRHGERKGGHSVERVIVHITGVRELSKVVSNFTTQPVSAHYLIDKNGELHQFVSEDKAAWHSGIKSFVRKLYDKDDGSWRKYKRYFSWSRDYPSDSVFLDANGQRVDRNSGRAALVARPDMSEWPDYDYFDKRWGRINMPIGYPDVLNPNYNSIGIEILGLGSKHPSDSEYTAEMYEALNALIHDICKRHNLKKELGVVCGHEDVNPVERWGWDPNSGFDWAKALS